MGIKKPVKEYIEQTQANKWEQNDVDRFLRMHSCGFGYHPYKHNIYISLMILQHIMM